MSSIRFRHQLKSIRFPVPTCQILNFCIASSFIASSSTDEDIPDEEKTEEKSETDSQVFINTFESDDRFVVTFNDHETNEEIFKELEKKETVTIAEPKEYSNTFQLRQASSSAVDSSMSVLSSALHTFLLAHQEYVTLLQSAIKALLRGLEVTPAMCEQLGIEEYLSLVQSEIFLQKSQISDSLFIFEESTKLLNLAANISFLVGNEISSGLASSHLHNVQQEVY